MQREEILTLFKMVGEEMEKRGATAEIVLAGGTAMILLLGNREGTKDVDAYFRGDVSVLREAAAVVAARTGLPADWLNDALTEGFASVHTPVACGEGKEQTSGKTFDAQFAAPGGSRAIKGFFATTPPESLWGQFPGLRIYIVTPEYLFAMRAAAGRPEDVADLAALVNFLGIKDAATALGLVEKYIPARLLVPKMRYIVEGLFENA